jgi:hypothetical protein
MAQDARCENLTRRSWLLAGLGMGLCAPAFQAVGNAALALRRDNEILYVSAPNLHFLQGKPLERLKDGASVTFISQLSLSFDDNRTPPFRRLPERFIFSYDIWEEKFLISRLGGAQRKGLSAAAAETWCLESLAISTSGVPPDKPVWIRLDLRAVDPKDQAGLVGDFGISLKGLIDTFSRPARSQQPHWTLDTGPIRLVDIKKAESSRGPRVG